MRRCEETVEWSSTPLVHNSSATLPGHTFDVNTALEFHQTDCLNGCVSVVTLVGMANKQRLGVLVLSGFRHEHRQTDLRGVLVAWECG